MRPNNVELMYDHVRAIHRAVTGKDPPKTGEREQSKQIPTVAQLQSAFAALEALARALPNVAERVPPFSFAPPFDVIDTEGELIVELGVPGADRDTVDATIDDDRLIVTGSRASTAVLDGRIYLHAEIPRGPFSRNLRVPAAAAVGARPRVEVENGIVRVRIAKSNKSPLPQA
jgi:HSP20 family molecular chaperone IbpA